MKLLISKLANFEQPLNISPTFVTFSMVKLDKSTEINCEQRKNILTTLVALGALNPSIFNVSSFVKPLNILYKVVTFGIFQLFMFIIFTLSNLGFVYSLSLPKIELKLVKTGALKLFISNSVTDVQFLNILLTLVNFSAFQLFNINLVNFEQLTNIDAIFVTFDTSKWLKSSVPSNDEQPLNIALIFVTLLVLNFVTSILDNDEHQLNILPISVTLLVLKLLISKLANFEQPLNISPALVTPSVVAKLSKSSVTILVKFLNK